MKLIKVTAENFASYEYIELDFTDSNLTLISGPTGSGKSTLLDLVCWALYGVTAKNGSVDEVRSWNTPTKATKAILSVLVGSQQITITRIRSATAGQNDLYWTGITGQHRGKSLSETQVLLEHVLGCEVEQYLTGAYFHEFSKTSTFFLSKAKDRRVVFENIAELKFATRIAGASSEAKSKAKKELREAEADLIRLKDKLELTANTHNQCLSAIVKWETKKDLKVQELKKKMASFDNDKLVKIQKLKRQSEEFETKRDMELSRIVRLIEELPPGVACDKCGAPNGGVRREAHANLLSNTANMENPYLSKILIEEAITNDYALQIENSESEENPFLIQKDATFCYIIDLNSSIEGQETYVSFLKDRNVAYESIYQLSFELRGELLKRSIKQVEEATNKNLENYFDSELRIVFTLDADELNTEIYKNGNQCVYSQLSKGQRGLLKLTFAVAIMDSVSTSTGIKFNTLFFDEALDGYDTTLKLKAYRLFEDLALKHDNVYVIDHSEELRSLFSTVTQVYMKDNVSYIKHG